MPKAHSTLSTEGELNANENVFLDTWRGWSRIFLWREIYERNFPEEDPIVCVILKNLTMVAIAMDWLGTAGLKWKWWQF